VTIKQHVDHWLNSSDESYRDMTALLEKKRWTASLYFGHLTLEKLLKAILAANNVQIIYTHKLCLLADACGLVLSDEQREELDIITEFNTATRYASVKAAIYKRCTPAYTKAQIRIIKKWKKYMREAVINCRATVTDKTTASYPEKSFK